LIGFLIKVTEVLNCSCVCFPGRKFTAVFAKMSVPNPGMRTGVARTHKLRIPDAGWLAPCLVCRSTREISVNSCAYRLPESGTRLIVKILEWQEHCRRCQPNATLLDVQPVAGFSLATAQSQQPATTSAVLPLCQSCVDLLTRMDKVEREFYSLLAEFCSLLQTDSERDKEKEGQSVEPPECPMGVQPSSENQQNQNGLVVQ
jgi:hypothetical protein